ncbi:MAG TPA: hypothetical protein PKE69_06815 [Pyrinomonadaceae bacterium]|nr:hypothetical protein [Pyrinomonadaceae bacterium]
MNNVKKTRPERPDKPIFFVMIGAFFVFFSLPAFYWANYSYGEYSRTSEFVRELREKPTANLTLNDKKELENRISINSSMVERYKLEMFLSGAGGLVLFGIALIIFKKAFSANKRKNFYEKADFRNIPIPNAPIKIENKNIYGVLFWLILIFFGGMFLLTTYQSFSSKFITFENAIIRTSLFGIPLILFIAVFLLLMFRAKKNVVKIIDNSGITRGDGRHFSWQNFCGVVQQIAFNRRTQRKYTWRIELAFADGETAWLIPNRIKNAQEVFDYVAQLPNAVLKSQ